MQFYPNLYNFEKGIMKKQCELIWDTFVLLMSVSLVRLPDFLWDRKSESGEVTGYHLLPVSTSYQMEHYSPNCGTCIW